MVRACRVVGDLGVSADKTGSLARCRSPVVHRRVRVVRAKLQDARLQTLGYANLAQELGRLAHRLLESLGLRCCRPAVEHV
eukprot:3922663-Pleurochrysis_carterae.AAC.1